MIELWKHTPRGNLALSPASIAIALAMVEAGAAGETKREIQRVLGGPWKLPEPRSLELRIANRLYAQRGYAFEPAFVEQVPAFEEVDFRAPEAVRGAINAWVARETRDRIRDLMPAGALTADARLVLVNALYFLAQWETKFKHEATYDAPFTTASGERVKTPTMHASGSYRLAELGGVSVLELPYKGGEAAMLIAVPERVDGLPDVERGLDRHTIDGWRRALAPAPLLVAVPKFTIDLAKPLELSRMLAAIGMPLAFDPERADFSAMAKPTSRAEELYLATVFHKAFVKVDENGTEAAAATAASMMVRGGVRLPRQTFAADHPFLFLLVDANGLVLFVGRVDDPR